MLHPCSKATKLSYFDGSKAGFTLFILVLVLFPAGEGRILLPLCTARTLAVKLKSSLTLSPP